jgi:predicted NAD/FAD-binding protein
MQKLAIIGTGIAGMSAAYFLKDQFQIRVFEQNDYVGGHTNTIEVDDGTEKLPMDTGFMVFNEKTYPNLLNLFKKLQVPYENTDMSFSVRNHELDLEFNGTSALGLFAQKKNLVNFRFIKMIREILKFNQSAPIMLNNPRFDDMSIDQYIKELGLSEYFFTNFLVPMSSAVWSTPTAKMRDFPAKSLVRFFYNHGFVGVNTQLQWKTVSGGSREYRDRLISEFSENISCNSKIASISEDEKGVRVRGQGVDQYFDKVIIATHADEALGLLESPSEFQQQVLSKFSYQKNEAVVHTDSSVMPKLRKNWSSWNFLMRENKSYTVYYMNRLQRLSDRENFFVNINGEEFVAKDKIRQKITYHHPVFTTESVKAQKKISELNERSKIHFTGSYYRYGFHEDALLSSVDLCKQLLGREVLT